MLYKIKKSWCVIFIALAATIIGLKQFFKYSLAPIKPKGCNFIFPENTTKTMAIFTSVPKWFSQIGGTTNDASCLNKTPVFGVVTVKSGDDVKNAISFAKQNNIKITPAGEHHSMGGQSFVGGGVVLDMRQFNTIEIDTEKKIARVQSGATWQQLQDRLDPLGLSVKAMQSINIFSIGGTLSVNAHGLSPIGSVASTVRQIRIMTADGEVVTASPTENSELFRHVLGGYGLFGVILDADLDLTDNTLYDWQTKYLDYHEFPDYFEKNIKNNPAVGLTFARLSMNPFSYLQETAVHTFSTISSTEPIPPIASLKNSWIERFIFNFSKTSRFGKWVRAMSEKHLKKTLTPCVTSRNNGLTDGTECLLTRNFAMYDSMPYLQNRLASTDILQEYFIPHDQFISFVDDLRAIVRNNNANLLNVTIRIVPKDNITALPYAKDDMFALVLYFNQKLNKQESEKIQKTTQQLIDLANQHHGTFYLPYQLHYSPEQLRDSYPEMDNFFTKKHSFDQEEIFVNTWYAKYGH